MDVFSEVFPPLSLSGVRFFLDRLEFESTEQQESKKAFLYGIKICLFQGYVRFAIPKNQNYFTSSDPHHDISKQPR